MRVIRAVGAFAAFLLASITIFYGPHLFSFYYREGTLRGVLPLQVEGRPYLLTYEYVDLWWMRAIEDDVRDIPDTLYRLRVLDGSTLEVVAQSGGLWGWWDGCVQASSTQLWCAKKRSASLYALPSLTRLSSTAELQQTHPELVDIHKIGTLNPSRLAVMNDRGRSAILTTDGVEPIAVWPDVAKPVGWSQPPVRSYHSPDLRHPPVSLTATQDGEFVRLQGGFSGPGPEFLKPLIVEYFEQEHSTLVAHSPSLSSHAQVLSYVDASGVVVWSYTSSEGAFKAVVPVGTALFLVYPRGGFFGGEDRVLLERSTGRVLAQ